MYFFRVLFKGRVSEPFVYRSAVGVPIFARVQVRLRGKLRVGLVLSLLSSKEVDALDFRVQPIERVVDNISQLSRLDLLFARWLSRYYFSFLGDVLALFLPFSAGKQKEIGEKSNDVEASTDSKRAGKQLEEIEGSSAIAADSGEKGTVSKIETPSEILKTIPSKNLTNDANGFKDIPLSDSQQKIVVEISKNRKALALGKKAANSDDVSKANNVNNSRLAVGLLEGVTGSGKSFIYASLAQKELRLGCSVMVLVPEIAIVFQTERLFKKFIPEQKIHIFHSKQSVAKKKKLRDAIDSQQSPLLVLGTRSCLFLPRFTNIGLLIVDEEHEDAYKNNYAPRYHIRQAAQVFARQRSAFLLFSSATPSVEMKYQATRGMFFHYRLLKRYNPHPAPKTKVFEVKKERVGSQQEISLFRKETLAEIEATVKKQATAMVFINRRGFSSVLACASCGSFSSCPNCDISLTYYNRRQLLQCHYCDYRKTVDVTEKKPCSSCGKTEGYKFYKGGTEKTADFLTSYFPSFNIERFDSEAMTTEKKITKVLSDFASGKVDILVGTQMLAKGHDFPKASLMLIVRPEGVLALPDFRASERLFRVVVQARGRVGRQKKEQASVIIETTIGSDETLQKACAGEYESFYEEQIRSRKLFFYPPFAKIAKFVVRGRQVEKVMVVAKSLREQLLKRLIDAVKAGTIVVLPAVPCFFVKLQGNYRYQVVVKISDYNFFFEKVHGLENETRGLFCAVAGTHVEIDIDPVDLF